ncbi:hypothetical protein [Sphingomonas sp. Marseille-Q8236]
MVALTVDRNTPRRENHDIEGHPVKGGANIFAGALVMLDAAGWAIPGGLGAGLAVVGRADAPAKAIVNGDAIVTTRRGVFRFANSAGGDAITRADIGKSAYVVDDQTLAKTDNAGTRSAAGIIRDVDAQGVWVRI